MNIEINDHRKILAVQEEFNKFFPHLKIEFMTKPSKVGSAPSGKMHGDAGTLGDCRVVHNKGNLTLSPAMTIADLKETLRDTYGLSVKIFRQSNKKWTEVTGNSNSTLAE